MSRKSIVITGASDGIGKALAWEMAGRGYDLGLTARRAELLEELKGNIESRHANCNVVTRVLDVTDYEAVAPAMTFLAEALGKVDIVIANAGIAKAGVVGKSPLELHLDVINTNVNGAIATLSAALELFRKQGYGHLVGTSSVAAYRGMPRNAAYSASKAALSTFMEGLRAETYNEAIDVSVLHPGYIDTAINRDLKSRPFVIDVEAGAKMFADLIEKKVKRACVPRFPWGVVGPLLRHLPTRVIAKM